MRLFSILLGLLCLTLLAGCGTQSLPTDGQGNQLLIRSNENQLNARVKQLPNDGSIEVADISDGSITLLGQVPTIQVGDIVARSQGENQFLRRVVSIQTSGNRTTITTAPVALNEVFDSANINVTTFMGPEFLRTLQPEIPGVTFGEPEVVPAKTEEVAAWRLPIQFNEALINDGARGSVTVNGNISLRIALQSELQVGVKNFIVPTVNRFVLQPIVTVDGTLTVTGEGSGNFRKEVLLTRIAHPLVGPFAPVSLYLAGDLLISVDGDVQANGQVRMQGRVNMQAGVQCINDNWASVQSLESDFSAEAPQLFASARLNANVVQPRLTLSLLDMGQIYVNANILRFEVEADATQAAFNVNVFRTYTIEAGAKLAIAAKINGIGPELRYDGALDPVTGPRTLVASITVNKPTPPSNPVGMFVLPFKGSNQLRLGEEAFFLTLATIGPFGAPLPVASDWTSSNSQTLQVRSFGFIGIAKAIRAGNAEVQARFNAASQGSFPIVVSSSGLRTLQVIDEGAAYRSEGEVLRRSISTSNQVNQLDSLQYRAIGTYADGTQVDLSYSVNWSSADASKARVFRNGQVLGISSGLADISASINQLSSVANLLIQIPTIQHMHITPLDPAAVSVDTGQTVQLRAVGRDSKANVRDITNNVTWRSVSPSIATVDKGLVRGVKAGETVITAVTSNGAVVAKKLVRINKLAVTRVEIEPAAPTNLLTNSSLQFRAFARYSDGSREEITTLANWFSNNDGVASISANGLLTTKVAAGKIKVKATYNNVTGSSPVFDVSLASSQLRSLRLRRTLPTSSDVGRLLPLEVEVLTGGIVDANFSGDVTVTKGPGSSAGNLTGTTSVRVNNGLARFTDVSFDTIGNYSLIISGGGASDLTPPPIAVQTFGFDHPRDLPVGRRPLSIAFGNLNDDTIPDLVTPNGLSQDASVVLNNGNGNFAAAVAQAIGANSPEDVAVADMNGDGREDFVAVSQSANGVHLFLRQPDGTFTRFDMAAQSNPFGVAVGLVTQGDNRPDIVVSNVASNSVTLLSQAPNGGFSASHFAVGQAPNSVALADLNGDGRTDIVTSNFNSNSVSICYQNADGTFLVTSQTVSNRPEKVVIDDMDRDGRLDLIVACASGDLTVLHQTAPNAFTRSNSTLGGIPVSVATGDVNGDGRPDVVVGYLTGGGMDYLQQTVTGTFTRARLPADSGIRGVVITDLNGDGRLDIAGANEITNVITVILTQ